LQLKQFSYCAATKVYYLKTLEGQEINANGVKGLTQSIAKSIAFWLEQDF
jgi:hypothetical protein